MRLPFSKKEISKTFNIVKLEIFVHFSKGSFFYKIIDFIAGIKKMHKLQIIKKLNTLLAL